MWRSYVFTDAGNNLYAIYKVLSGDGNSLSMLVYNGSDWSSAGTNPFSDDGVDHFAAAAYSGSVYVVYNSGDNSDRAKAAVFNGAEWQTLGPIDGFSAGSAKWFDIEISSTGIPYVAYSDVIRDERISIKRFVNNSWVSVGDDLDFPDTETVRIDLNILSNGTLQVAGFSTGTGSTQLVRYTSAP